MGNAAASHTQNVVVLPVWTVRLLVTIAIALIGVVFTAGGTYYAIDSFSKRLDRIENRFDHLEERLGIGVERGAKKESKPYDQQPQS